jgi:L-2-hydroxyglutarate oxidase LhgO
MLRGELKEEVIVEKFDVVIVGAGIIGLSVARALKSTQPSLKILVCEKEPAPGLHASGRNSGVLHAGFYYSPESLKARFCRDGNKELREFIKLKNLPLLQTGKVVVTKSEEEEAKLVALFNRGISNGVELELLPARDLRKFEPLATTHNSFMWSPNTAVSDPHAVIIALSDELTSDGVEISYSSQISDFKDGIAKLNGIEIGFGHLVNSAGSQADRIAHTFGVGKEFSMLPFIGMYRFVNQNKLPIRTLVYPVPHVINPFLGVHFTLTFDGMVKIGPTAIPVVGREQYNLLGGFNLLDFKSTFLSSLALSKGTHHSIFQIARSEFPKYSSRFLIRESSKLVPSASLVSGWKVKPPGIRSQLVNRTTGELVQDFLLEKGPHSTHILNAVSPGWTSALPFGKYIANQVLSEI